MPKPASRPALCAPSYPASWHLAMVLTPVSHTSLGTPRPPRIAPVTLAALQTGVAMASGRRERSPVKPARGPVVALA
jgi:hypothetical protein